MGLAGGVALAWRRARLQSVVAGRLAARLCLVCLSHGLACSSGRARANYHLQPPVGQKRFSVAELQYWFLRASGASRLADLPVITYDEDPARWSTVTTTLCEMQSVPGSTAQYLHHHQNQ